MLRTTFTLFLCLALAAFGVFLLSHAALNPGHATNGYRVFVAALGAVQVALSLAGLYLALARNPLWRTWQNSRPTADIRKLKAQPPVLAVTRLPGYDSAEAAAQAAIESMLAEPDRARAHLEEGLTAKSVPLSELSTYASELDPELILQGGFRTVFPVSLDGTVTTGVAVTKQGDGSWHFAELGFAPLAKSLAQAREDARTKFACEGCFMLVDVPAMAHHFLAFRSEGTLNLTCLSDWSSSPIKMGETLPAAEALARLQPLAAEKHKRYEEADGDLLGG